MSLTATLSADMENAAMSSECESASARHAVRRRRAACRPIRGRWPRTRRPRTPRLWRRRRPSARSLPAPPARRARSHRPRPEPPEASTGRPFLLFACRLRFSAWRASCSIRRASRSRIAAEHEVGERAVHARLDEPQPVLDLAPAHRAPPSRNLNVCPPTGLPVLHARLILCGFDRLPNVAMAAAARLSNSRPSSRTTARRLRPNSDASPLIAHRRPAPRCGRPASRP